MSQQDAVAQSGSQGFFTGSGPGSVGWTNPGYFPQANGTGLYAVSGTLTHTTVSKSVDAFNCGFTIPGGSTITGCQWLFDAYWSTHPVNIVGCNLTLAGQNGTPTTTNPSGTGLTSSPTSYFAGSTTDLWGISPTYWTVANISSPTQTNFCFSIWCGQALGSFVGAANANNAQCTCWYTTVFTPSPNVAAIIPVPFILLAGAWIPFTMQLARELAGTVCQFKQTVRPRRVSVGGYGRPLLLPRLILPKRFQTERPARVIAF
jgi:hypothetical protein